MFGPVLALWVLLVPSEHSRLDGFSKTCVLRLDNMELVHSLNDNVLTS